jgi:hypothetical protein
MANLFTFDLFRRYLHFLQIIVESYDTAGSMVTCIHMVFQPVFSAIFVI